ncbi:MAG: hypothetical protein U5L76_06190 [Patescibacteria group bacterium]|nr:hypothetical protein [Patescibacteria group bacterium]
MKINFLDNNKNGKNKLKRLGSNWKKFVYYLSWVGILSFGFIILARIINFVAFRLFDKLVVFNFPWLNNIDYFLFLFILLDLFIINRVLSKRGLRNEKFWVWFLIILLILNFTWSIAIVNYSNLGIYKLNVGMYYATLFIGFFSLTNTRKKISQLLKKSEIEIEKEKENENLKEEKRKKVFSKKFPRINKIPVFRNFIKWMYKEGWWFSIPLIIITIIFIVIKVGLPIIYTGSYVDEYNHILSGIEFFKTGHFAEIYHGSYYMRGAYVSFLAGLFMKLFGKTIYVAKMLPAMLGIANFFLLYKIGRKIFTNKTFILVLLAVFSTLPWFIFNHFYIRMYVFYEFFLLLLTFLFILIIQNIKNIKKISIYGIITLITLTILYFFSNDVGMYMVLLYSFFFMSYIFFFEIQKIPFKNKFYQKLSKNHVLKISIFLIFGILAVLYVDGFSLIERFISGSVTFTSGDEFKYSNLFFNLNLVFTVFFLLSLFLVFSKKIRNLTKLLILSSLALFLIHMSSSQDLQMTRIIIYYLPLFYLVSLISFERVGQILNNKIILVFLLLLLSLTIYSNYPNNFFSEGPHIPSEVGYRDYQKSIHSLIDIHKNTTIITHLPHIIQFYYPSINNSRMYLLRDKENSFYDIRLKYLKNNKTYYTPSDNVIITNSNNLENIIKESEVILLLDNSFFYSWTEKSSQKIIKDNFKKEKQLQGITIYIK